MIPRNEIQLLIAGRLYYRFLIQPDLSPQQMYWIVYAEIQIFITTIMKSASINEIKHELINSSPKELLELCLRLLKYKKENKELVTYLLFEASDLHSYIESIKKEIDEQFLQINSSNLYFAKKSLRKILKTTNKYIRYTSSKETEAELLIYFCSNIKKSGIKINKSVALTNFYSNQIKKIRLAVSILHEDLQYDYNNAIEPLI